jgi:hypothetical protein
VCTQAAASQHVAHGCGTRSAARVERVMKRLVTTAVSVLGNACAGGCVYQAVALRVQEAVEQVAGRNLWATHSTKLLVYFCVTSFNC